MSGAQQAIPRLLLLAHRHRFWNGGSSGNIINALPALEQQQQQLQLATTTTASPAQVRNRFRSVERTERERELGTADAEEKNERGRSIDRRRRRCTLRAALCGAVAATTKGELLLKHSLQKNSHTHTEPTTQLTQSAARFRDSFQSPPESLEFDRGRVEYPAALEGNLLGRALLSLIGAYGKKQRLLNGASVLHRAVAEASEDERLYEAFGLDPAAFMSGHSLATAHAWLVMHRLSLEGEQGSEARATAEQFKQLLYTHFVYRDMERRVHMEGVKYRVSSWLKKLEQFTYTSWLAFDRALDGEC